MVRISYVIEKKKLSAIINLLWIVWWKFVHVIIWKTTHQANQTILRFSFIYMQLAAQYDSDFLPWLYGTITDETSACKQ